MARARAMSEKDAIAHQKKMGRPIVNLNAPKNLVKRPKYGNEVTIVDGVKIDSKLESNRYQELRLMQKSGDISGLARQVKINLIPKQAGERACDFVCDFVYTTRNGEKVYEDAKGVLTPTYIIKRKLMKWLHGITVREVYRKPAPCARKQNRSTLSPRQSDTNSGSGDNAKRVSQRGR